MGVELVTAKVDPAFLARLALRSSPGNECVVLSYFDLAPPTCPRPESYQAVISACLRAVALTWRRGQFPGRSPRASPGSADATRRVTGLSEVPQGAICRCYGTTVTARIEHVVNSDAAGGETSAQKPVVSNNAAPGERAWKLAVAPPSVMPLCTRTLEFVLVGTGFE